MLPTIVSAVSDCHLWVLDRGVFQLITKKIGLEQHEAVLEALRKVQVFKTLNEDRLGKIADCLFPVRSSHSLTDRLND